MNPTQQPSIRTMMISKGVDPEWCRHMMRKVGSISRWVSISITAAFLTNISSGSLAEVYGSYSQAWGRCWYRKELILNDVVMWCVRLNQSHSGCKYCCCCWSASPPEVLLTFTEVTAKHKDNVDQDEPEYWTTPQWLLFNSSVGYNRCLPTIYT